MWNPSICNYECYKMYEINDCIDIKNCTFQKFVRDDSVLI